ncbi:ubiquitin-conjugating enzyme E2D 1, UBC4/5 homolog (yeast), isoform CRA_a, partial [Mus musculus]
FLIQHQLFLKEVESSSHIHSSQRFEISLTQEWNCSIRPASVCSRSWLSTWSGGALLWGDLCHLLSLLLYLKPTALSLALPCYLYFFPTQGAVMTVRRPLPFHEQNANSERAGAR